MVNSIENGQIPSQHSKTYQFRTTSEGNDFTIYTTRDIEESTSEKIRDHLLNHALNMSEQTIR